MPKNIGKRHASRITVIQGTSWDDRLSSIKQRLSIHKLDDYTGKALENFEVKWDNDLIWLSV